MKKKCRSTNEDLDSSDKRCSQQYKSRQYLEAKSFVSGLCKRYGDDQPDILEIHLPSCLSILQVWTVYKSSCENLESPICLTQGSMECGVKSFLMLKFQSIRSSANVTSVLQIFKETISEKLTILIWES